MGLPKRKPIELDFEPLTNPGIGATFYELLGLFPPRRISSDREHKKALDLTKKIMTILADKRFNSTQEKSDFSTYLDSLSTFVEQYESEHFPKTKTKGHEILEYLMESHDLKQVDLKDDLGSQSVVSEILSGKRKLNRRQIEALSARFRVSPNVFF